MDYKTTQGTPQDPESKSTAVMPEHPAIKETSYTPFKQFIWFTVLFRVVKS
jgi:hypothetical protein